MKILVTGADGFIGSHLCELLLKKKYNVRALVQYNSFNFHGWIDGLSDPNLEIFSGDIRDSNFCNELTKGIDLIFHMAALIAIPFSYTSPQSYIETNVIGTLNICQASKNNHIARIVITSTSEVYGTANYTPINENHPKQPQSPYSASKIGADMIAQSFYHSYNLPVVIARPFNTYGPRQSARAVIPTIITQIAAGKKEIIIGNLTPTRDFNYVSDVCTGLIKLAFCDEAIGKEVNIASNMEISIKELSELISNLMETKVVFLQDEKRLRPEKSEVFRLVGDNSLINALTGYRPETLLKDGLKKTIFWFSEKRNLSRYKVNIYNV